MSLTKSFNDLVQNRAANDPEFAAALREADGLPPLTMRDALRQIWEAILLWITIHPEPKAPHLRIIR